MVVQKQKFALLPTGVSTVNVAQIVEEGTDNVKEAI